MNDISHYTGICFLLPIKLSYNAFHGAIQTYGYTCSDLLNCYILAIYWTRVAYGRQIMLLLTDLCIQIATGSVPKCGAHVLWNPRRPSSSRKGISFTWVRTCLEILVHTLGPKSSLNSMFLYHYFESELTILDTQVWNPRLLMVIPKMNIQLIEERWQEQCMSHSMSKTKIHYPHYQCSSTKIRAKLANYIPNLLYVLFCCSMF